MHLTRYEQKTIVNYNAGEGARSQVDECNARTEAEQRHRQGREWLSRIREILQA